MLLTSKFLDNQSRTLKQLQQILLLPYTVGECSNFF